MNRKEQIKEELWCEALSRGYTMQYKALGGSMCPFIKSGDILTAKPTRRISTGDVIVYKKAKSITAHRVVGRRKIKGDPFFLTKGDASRGCDGLVSPSEVLGKVIAVKTRTGKIIKTDSFCRRIFKWGIAVIFPFFLPRIVPILRKAKALAFKRGTTT